jgi:hypothetical protein
MGEDRVTNDPMEAHYIGFNMWVNAVEAAGTTDVDAAASAMYGQSSEPDRRHGRNAAQPPPHQAGADRRDPGRRPVRHHQPDRAGAGRCLDRLPAGIGGAGRIGRASAAACTTPRPRPACRSSRTTDRFLLSPGGGAQSALPAHRARFSGFMHRIILFILRLFRRSAGRRAGFVQATGAGVGTGPNAASRQPRPDRESSRRTIGPVIEALGGSGQLPRPDLS